MFYVNRSAPCLHGMVLLGLSCRRFVKSPFSPAGSKAKKLIIIQVDAYMHDLMNTKDSGKQVAGRRHLFIDLFTTLNSPFFRVTCIDEINRLR